MMDIVGLIKSNKTLSALAYLLRGKLSTMRLRKYRKKPVDSAKVLLYRPLGGYGDSPKAVAERLHREHPGFRLIWACSDKRYFKDLPPYLTPVLFGSEEYHKHLATAGAWVCSATLPRGTTKKKGQLYIQTWHGDKGFKKFANDAAQDLTAYKEKTKNREFAEPEICDYFLTGARWFIPKIRSAIGYEGEVIAQGLPRNDCLVHWTPDIAETIKAKLGIPAETRVLLYAPTFRDHEKSHELVSTNIDLPAILRALEEKTGQSWLCLLRAHSGGELRLDVERERGKFADVTGYPDMADLLMITDMLITDYSSCAGDLALLDRFILLYQDDIASYTAVDRTLYFDMKDTPYFVAHDLEEALRLVDEVDEEKIKENCAAIRELYDVCETGKATEVVVDLILRNRARSEGDK